MPVGNRSVALPPSPPVREGELFRIAPDGTIVYSEGVNPSSYRPDAWQVIEAAAQRESAAQQVRTREPEVPKPAPAKSQEFVDRGACWQQEQRAQWQEQDAHLTAITALLREMIGALHGARVAPSTGSDDDAIAN